MVFHGPKNLCKRENCLRLCSVRGINDGVMALVCRDCAVELMNDHRRKIKVIHAAKRRRHAVEEVLKRKLRMEVWGLVMSYINVVELGAQKPNLEWTVHLESWGYDFVNIGKWAPDRR